MTAYSIAWSLAFAYFAVCVVLFVVKVPRYPRQRMR